MRADGRSAVDIAKRLNMKPRRLPDVREPSTLPVEWVVRLEHPKHPDSSLVSGAGEHHRRGIHHDSFAGESGDALCVTNTHLDHETSLKF